MICFQESKNYNMKILSLFLFTFFSQYVLGQVNGSNIKFKVTNSDEKYFYSEEDNRGNITFSKNVGMNGPITMISASEYDSLNRLIKSYWVHSNLGFYLNENVYEKKIVKNYKYKMSVDSSFSYDRQVLNKINTRKEFIEMDVFFNLQKGERQLRSIDFFDASDNKIKEVLLSEIGDTTDINTYKFNDKNQVIWFHKGKIGSETWTWDIYYQYDESSNRIKSTRVSSSNGVKDTTEVRCYYYNDNNLKTSENYYYKNTFRNKSEFVYNSKKQVIEVLFYERGENILDARTLYKYYKNGEVKKKIIFDYREKKDNQKEVFKYEQTVK